jgi:hypothetical protein
MTKIYQTEFVDETYTSQFENANTSTSNSDCDSDDFEDYEVFNKNYLNDQYIYTDEYFDNKISRISPYFKQMRAPLPVNYFPKKPLKKEEKVQDPVDNIKLILNWAQKPKSLETINNENEILLSQPQPKMDYEEKGWKTVEKTFKKKEQKQFDERSKSSTETDKSTTLKYTQICRNIINTGKCSYKKCSFAHTLKQLVINNCKFGNSCNHIVKKDKNFVNNEKTRKICNYKHPVESLDNYYNRIGLNKIFKK